MQYTSRIYLRFKNEEDWKNCLEESQFNDHSLFEYVDNFEKSFEVFGNGVRINKENLDCEIGDFFDESTVKKLCELFAQLIKDKGIILADSYNYSYYPESSYEYYYFGKELHEDYRYRGASNHFDIDISDCNKWLGATRKKALTDEEKGLLKEITKRNKA